MAVLLCCVQVLHQSPTEEIKQCRVSLCSSLPFGSLELFGDVKDVRDEVEPKVSAAEIEKEHWYSPKLHIDVQGHFNPPFGDADWGILDHKVFVVQLNCPRCLVHRVAELSLSFKIFGE